MHCGKKCFDIFFETLEDNEFIFFLQNSLRSGISSVMEKNIKNQMKLKRSYT